MTLVTTASLSGCSGAADAAYLEDIPGYEDAHEQAAVDCTGFGGGSDAFAVYQTTCVEDRTRRSLVAQGHDEAAHVPWHKEQ